MNIATYSKPKPPANSGLLLPDIVEHTDQTDERLWIPYGENVWWRPLMFDIAAGNHVELTKVTRRGVVSRHLHPNPVHGFTLRGSWRYLEHDWVARSGTYIFEPPGVIHTLVTDSDEEMLAVFHVDGAILYLDTDDKVTSYDDNVTLMKQAREHYDRVGLGADYVDRFVR